LSELHLDITLITTSDPDPNYDYKLEERIPGLIEKIENLYKNLKVSADQIKKICGNDKALTYAEMNNTLEDLKIFINNPFEIPSNISQFTNIMSQYGSWIEQLKAGTLSIDKILVIPSDEEYKIEKVSLIKRLYSSVATFISTFSKDYNSVIGSEIFDNNKEIIDVWYGGAQIYATELKDIIEKDFSNNSQIQVRFRLTPASQMSTGINAMLLAILSGEAPDVVLGAPSVEDYMMRNQCYDLKKFKDFDDVSKRFLDVCIEQLTYRGGVYAIPEAMNVNFMFYRSDIFKKLGLTVPKTWDEMLKNVVPKLAENNMSVAGSPGFDILLYQHGGELYNEDMTESLVASQTAWKAFKLHCDFYTMYGAPKAADFYNRFRSGEIPIGFGNIGTYIQFIYMAPELSNRWNIAVMPGVLEEDGSINKASYAAFWTRDFAYMIENAGELIPSEDIINGIEYLIYNADENGWMPDRVTKEGIPKYTAGHDDFFALPNLDNGCFAVLMVDSFLKSIDESKVQSLFFKWKDVLIKGLDCIPTNEDGFVLNCSEPPHSPYGFTDK